MACSKSHTSILHTSFFFFLVHEHAKCAHTDHWQLRGNAVYYSCAQNDPKIESYPQCCTSDIAEVILTICCDLLWQKFQASSLWSAFAFCVMLRVGFTVCLQFAVKKVVEAVHEAAVISCQCTHLTEGIEKCTVLMYTNASTWFGPRLLSFTLHRKKKRRNKTRSKEKQRYGEARGRAGEETRKEQSQQKPLQASILHNSTNGRPSGLFLHPQLRSRQEVDGDRLLASAERS